VPSALPLPNMAGETASIASSNDSRFDFDTGIDPDSSYLVAQALADHSYLVASREVLRVQEEKMLEERARAERERDEKERAAEEKLASIWERSCPSLRRIIWCSERVWEKGRQI